MANVAIGSVEKHNSYLRSPVTLCDTDNTTSGKDLLGNLLLHLIDVHLLLLRLLLLFEFGAFLLDIIVFQSN